MGLPRFQKLQNVHAPALQSGGIFHDTGGALPVIAGERRDEENRPGLHGGLIGEKLIVDQMSLFKEDIVQHREPEELLPPPACPVVLRPLFRRHSLSLHTLLIHQHTKS